MILFQNTLSFGKKLVEKVDFVAAGEVEIADFETLFAAMAWADDARDTGGGRYRKHVYHDEGGTGYSMRAVFEFENQVTAVHFSLIF